MSEAKRYAIISDDWDYVESPSGGFVDHDDYAALAAERDHLKACQEIAQLHITGLVAERNAALRQRDKLAEALRDVESAYTTAIHWEDMQTAMAQIKTALSELTPWTPFR